MRTRTKKCRKCRERKDISAFPTHHTSSDGHASYCFDCRNTLHRKRHEKDPKARLAHHIATRIDKDFPKTPGLHKDLEKHLGYKMSRLTRKLKRELAEKHGMGLRAAFAAGWHLDHIRPLSSFDIKEVGDAEFKKCWAVANLEMIPAEDNLAKGAKWDGDDGGPESRAA